MISKLNEEDFNEVKKDGVVLVDFYADWCGPCRMLSPVVEEVSSKLNLRTIKVNVDEREDIAREYGIMTIPTLILFENGTEKKRQSGFMNSDELENFIMCCR